MLAIVAVVVPLFSPALSVARMGAKQTVCLSNLHQICLVARLYEQDYSDCPPNSLTWPALQAYDRRLLPCSASRGPTHEFDYLPVWRFAVDEERSERHRLFVEAWRECKEMRQGEIPIVPDNNHRHTRPMPGVVLLILREAGAAKTVPAPRSRMAGVGPCKVPALGIECNL